MHHQSYIWFVYSHTEGIGGNHYAYSSFLPVTLTEVLFKVGQSGMEEGC